MREHALIETHMRPSPNMFDLLSISCRSASVPMVNLAPLSNYCLGGRSPDIQCILIEKSYPMNTYIEIISNAFLSTLKLWPIHSYCKIIFNIFQWWDHIQSILIINHIQLQNYIQYLPSRSSSNAMYHK